MECEAIESLPGRMKFNLGSLLNWKRIPREKTSLLVGLLCRFRSRNDEAKLSNFLSCDIHGAFTPPITAKYFDDCDILVFVGGAREFYPSVTRSPIRRNGDAIFYSKYGLVRGPLTDVEIQAG